MRESGLLSAKRDQTVYRVVDLLEGLSGDFVVELRESLTPSQRSFTVEYCRKILNGVGFLQGTAGFGKTTIMRALVKVAQKRGWKVAILMDSNSAADNVVQTVASQESITARVHPIDKYLNL